MPEVKKQYDFSYTQNRELSWLSFNRRVMEEAADSQVPLMERLRFLSIFTSNLDEFFMVRVGSLMDLALLTPEERENKSGKTPQQQLSMIYDAVRPLIRMRDAIYFKLMEELEQRGIRDIPYADLTGSSREYVHQYYRDNIRPLLSPQIIDHNHPFPHLKNKAIYGAALLRKKPEHCWALCRCRKVCRRFLCCRISRDATCGRKPFCPIISGKSSISIW